MEAEPPDKMSKSDERFFFDVSFDKLSNFKEGSCPRNTIKNTQWAIRNFEEWRVARNARFPNDRCPDDGLCSESQPNLCEWLCKFISETRKANGEEYTPRSLYFILSGLQRHLHQVRPSEDLNIFQNAFFKPLKNVCDSLFKKLHSKGIGTETKATTVISASEEDKLWESGVINMDTPQGLLRGFFYNGKHFCLRGGQEQRNLRLSQFLRETTVVDGKSHGCYIYKEFGSKNHQGGFNSLNVKNKVVKQYENTANPERCHVKLLDKYFEVLPREAKDNDAFYLTPLSKKPSDTLKPWYSKSPVGHNRLNTMLKEMCQEAEISGKFTNHSLRAYGTSTMFQANVPEKLIQQRTGPWKRYASMSVPQKASLWMYQM